MREKQYRIRVAADYEVMKQCNDDGMGAIPVTQQSGNVEETSDDMWWTMVCCKRETVFACNLILPCQLG